MLNKKSKVRVSKHKSNVCVPHWSVASFLWAPFSALSIYNINGLTLFLWICRIRPVFRLWRAMPKTSLVLASTQSCPSSSLDQKTVRRNTNLSSPLYTNIHTMHIIFWPQRSFLQSNVTFSLCRYGAHLALKHLPPGEHSELWHGESVVRVRT